MLMARSMRWGAQNNLTHSPLDKGASDRPTRHGCLVPFGGGYIQACSLNPDGAVFCGFDEPGSAAIELTPYSPPGAGAFSTIAVPVVGRMCGIRLDGTAVCPSERYDAPDGTFVALDVEDFGEGSYACGVRTNGALNCCGYDEWNKELPDPPSGTYSDVRVGKSHACALGVDQRVVCWGWKGYHQTRFVQHRGHFVKEWFNEGLLLRNRVAVLEPPDDAFQSVTIASGSVCGLELNGEVQCWGDADVLGAHGPTGEFTSIEGLCGLRADSTFACRATLLPQGISWSNSAPNCTVTPLENGSNRGNATSDDSLCSIVTDSEKRQDDAPIWQSDTTPLPEIQVDTNYSYSFLKRFRSTPDRCWVGIGWEQWSRWMYDISPGTGYEYPGSGSIADLCGTDATEHFWSNFDLPDLEYIVGSTRSG